MIYTSYFGNVTTINPIAICGSIPSSFEGKHYKKLAPKYWFFKKYKESLADGDNSFTEEDYTLFYKKEVLDTLDAKTVMAELSAFYNTETFTLLCYERPYEFCHRHLVADWLHYNGYQCKEL